MKLIQTVAGRSFDGPDHPLPVYGLSFWTQCSRFSEDRGLPWLFFPAPTAKYQQGRKGFEILGAEMQS
jgi:hypothetical protein